MLIFASIWNFVPENTLKLTLLHHCGIVKILHNSKCVPMCPVVLLLKLVTLVYVCLCYWFTFFLP